MNENVVKLVPKHQGLAHPYCVKHCTGLDGSLN